MFRKTMIVNDDEIALFVSSKIIGKTNFADEVITVTNGLKALQVFEDLLLNSKNPDQAPEIVFLDLHMPVMDGWEFLEIFEEKYGGIFPAVRFVILSSSIDPDDLEKIKRFSSVIDLIQTPLNFDILNELREKFAASGIHFSAHDQLTATKGQMIA